MIARGRYDWIDPDIDELNFRPKTLSLGSRPKCFSLKELFPGREWVKSKEVIARLSELGHKPASLGDLLVYGAKHPERQRKYCIVALGSVAVAGGRRKVTHLGSNAPKRGLYLERHGTLWRLCHRFLAVRT
jgi:hypothetical protein